MVDNEELPEEIGEEYYGAGERQRTGVAWLLAFATLAVTVLVAAGLFAGGRWVYRQIAGNDSETEQTTSQSTQNDTKSTNKDSSDKAEDDSEKPADNNTTDDEQSDQEQDQSEDSAVAGDSTENLPDTGPANTAAVFLAVSAVGYIIHRLRSQTES